MSEPTRPAGVPSSRPDPAIPGTPATRETPTRPTTPGTGPQPTKPVADRPKLVPPDHTRTSYTWLALVAAAIALVLLIIFILQNTQNVTVTFLAFEGTLPLAVALLIAAAATLILTLAVGALRILQLRRFSRKAAKTANRPRT